MSLYQPKGSKKWVYDFFFEGQRIREQTGTRSKTLAAKMEAKRRRELEEGAAGFKKKKPALLFAVAAEKYVERKTAEWQPKTLAIALNAKAHLLPAFSGRLLLDIAPEDIRRYRKQRIAEGAAPRTVNIEVGFLRSVMGSLWARLKDDDDRVTLLPEPDSIGHKLQPEDEAHLLQECSRSRSRVLYPFVTLAIETGAGKMSSAPCAGSGLTSVIAAFSSARTRLPAVPGASSRSTSGRWRY
jgi:hypothetical protein